MSNIALFPTLRLVPFATVWCAPRSEEEQMPITSNNLPPSPGDTSRGPRGVEATRKARGSVDSVRVWALGIVLNRETLHTRELCVAKA
jgi:hypothetical protein